VGPGDEVVVPTLTFAATANAVTYVGARPIFVDADPATWQLDPALLADTLAERARRGRRPAAVISVDLYGQCADYDRINAACLDFDVPLVEDAAEALGATYRDRAAGSLGAIGVFSFNGNKIITTSGGGMLVSDSEQWVQRARHLATQARDPAPHYEHSEIGHNYRLSNLLAALGRAQLGALPEKVAARRAVNSRYRDALGDLPGLTFMPEAEYGRCTFWLTTLTVDPAAFGAGREDMRLQLERHDIESRPVWKPMHLQPVFADCEVIGGAVAAGLFEQGLCLPSGSSLREADLDRVVSAFRGSR
jgi:dTDP-4-amino-4,6-dideoxygalactose transaminase